MWARGAESDQAEELGRRAEEAWTAMGLAADEIPITASENYLNVWEEVQTELGWERHVLWTAPLDALYDRSANFDMSRLRRLSEVARSEVQAL